MKWPEEIQDEDIDIHINEWKLSGYHVAKAGVVVSIEETISFSTGVFPVPIPVAMYVQDDEGSWGEILHRHLEQHPIVYP